MNPWLARCLALPLVLGVAGTAAPGAPPRTTDAAIRDYQSAAARDPGDARHYARLGGAYIQKARESGDVTYHDLAAKALARALALGPDPWTAATVATQLGSVHFARHEFKAALARVEEALRHVPGALFPHTLVGDAYLELGDYDRAAAAYAKLAVVTGPAHPHDRLAHLRFLRGDPPGAIEEMQRGVRALAGADVPGENLAWAQCQLGELWLQVGDLGKSAAAYAEALASYPGYHRALGGLARVRAAQASYDEAIELYRKALGVIPLPEYAAGLGDVYTKIGRAREARKQYDLVEYIGLLNSLNKVVYNRELALFYADHDLKPTQALELAERELEVRRDIYTHDVLAWARYKNGRFREALAAMTEALRLGTKDARLFFHAGMVHRAVGDGEQARAHLQRALATNPHFHVLQADVARRVLRELGGQRHEP